MSIFKCKNCTDRLTVSEMRSPEPEDQVRVTPGYRLFMDARGPSGDGSTYQVQASDQFYWWIEEATTGKVVEYGFSGNKARSSHKGRMALLRWLSK